MSADVPSLDRLREVDDLGPPHGGAIGGPAQALPRARTVPAPVGWREAIVAAALAVRNRPALIGPGLLGFLARGGVVAFALPIVVLPTPTGISTFIGGTALTGAGASDGLIRLIAASVILVAVCLVAGMLLGAIADVLLGREAVALGYSGPPDPPTDHRRPPVEAASRMSIPLSPYLVGQLILVRVATLVPVAVAVAWAMSRLVAAGYHQLILPDDLTVALPVRILAEALDAVLIVAGVWLAAEFVGGLAVRHVLFGGRSASSAIGAAIVSAGRRPLSSVAGYLLGVIALAVVAGAALLAAAALWSRLQILLADDVPILLIVPVTMAFVLAWGGGLLLVGIVVTWRSLFGSLDLLRVRAGSANAAITNAAIGGHSTVSPATGSGAQAAPQER